MNPRSIDLTRSANLIVQRLLAVKPGEQVAIVCDPHSVMSMAYALAGEVETAGGEFTILMMPTRQTDRKNDLTAIIERGLAAADCLIGLTGSSGAPTYSSVVKKLYDSRKLRTISMVMRNLDNFTGGGALADYDALYEDGKRLAAIWEKAGWIHVTSPAGTDLKAPIAGEKVIIECGFAVEPGQEAAFSDGEVSQMPRAASAEGVIVVDEPTAGLAKMLAQEVYRMLADLRDGHDLTILLVDQEIRQALKIADYVYVLELGRNKFDGPVEEFVDVKKAFWA